MSYISEYGMQVRVRPLKDGQMRIEFTKKPGDIMPLHWCDVPESQVEAEIQKYQKAYEEREAREQEIGRQLYADLPADIIPDEFKSEHAKYVRKSDGGPDPR